MFFSRLSSLSLLLLFLRSTDANYKSNLHFQPTEAGASFDRALGAAIESRFEIEFKKASEEALLKSSITKGLSRGGRFYNKQEPLCKFEIAYMNWNKFIEEQLCPALNADEGAKFCDKSSGDCFVRFDCYGNGSSIGAVPVKQCVRNEHAHFAHACQRERLDSGQFCHNIDPMFAALDFLYMCPVEFGSHHAEHMRKQRCCEHKLGLNAHKNLMCVNAYTHNSYDEYELYIRVRTKGVLSGPDRNRKYRHMIKYQLPDNCCAHMPHYQWS